MKRKIQLATAVAAVLAMTLAISCERTVTRIEQTVQASNCFVCHSDQDISLVAAEQQWIRSTHASGNNISHNTAPCNECHTHEGFIAKVADGRVERA